MVICGRLLWSSVGGYSGHLREAIVVICGRLLWSSLGGYCGHL